MTSEVVIDVQQKEISIALLEDKTSRNSILSLKQLAYPTLRKKEACKTH